jgi:protein TonB
LTAAAFGKRPDARAFEKYYPSRALEREKTGKVRLRCKVTANGSLTGCQVLNEDPPNWGFGDASMKITREFSVNPATADGRPTDGGVIEFTVSWTM